MFAAYFIPRVRDTHIDFLRLLFLVSVICPLIQEHSGELRNGALQIWRGVVCFSGDFTFRINILNSISTPHKH